MARAPKLWHPPKYKRAEARAIQAISAYANGGDTPPSPQDCKRAMDCIVEKISLYYDNGFVDEDPNGRIGAFIDGRQLVGKEIVMLSKLKAEIFDE